MVTDDDIKLQIQFRQIGAKIAYYRTLRGLRQDELAKMANVSTSVLSRIERGKYNNNIPVAMLLVMGEALRVEPSLFLTFNEEEKRMWWEDLSLETKVRECKHSNLKQDTEMPNGKKTGKREGSDTN